jgi:hypothetical protein
MNEQVVTEYQYNYCHSNHAKITGTIKTVNIANRDCQMLSILYNRFKRHVTLEGVQFVEVPTEVL